MEESSNTSGKNYCHGNTKTTSVANDGTLIKKGPWKPEEDQVLLNHVNKYGPRDWSSIRSKGLLKRTGKSCRLRWVNKLRPDLKNGCKFTAEEERVVIELQSQLGNKWATIAKHLSGRTDNDVKNFWSSRQKRLARILPSQSPQPNKRHKSSSSSTFGNDSRINSLFLEVPKTSFAEGGASSKGQCSSSSSQPGVITDTIQQMIAFPDALNPNYSTSEAANSINLGLIPLSESPANKLQLDEIPFPSISLPPETQELIDRLDSGFLQTFGYIDEPVLADDGSQLLSCCGAEMQEPTGAKGVIDHPVTPDSFFDDFPSDMFEIEPLPSPSSW
ncbi:transcription factor DUO1-like [Silene latifolia]|uniref:transcription factor DUO1-like n=1 Tax=Silene latifolia TaxID=37657 RepID=UPI003D7790B2